MGKWLCFIVITGLFVVSQVNCGGKANYSASQVWETDRILEVPESVYYDHKNDILYISCINGKPLDQDGNGYISKVDTTGTIIKRKWVTGMSAPKGMGTWGNVLFVTDINRIHKIDITAGEILSSHKAPKSKFLNDIAVDESGRVFISDMMDKKLYVLNHEGLSPWLDLDYDKPNGLYYSGGILYVGTARGIVTVNTGTKETALTVPHKGGIDGLKFLSKGNYIVSDWNGRVEIIGKNPRVLFDTTGEKINAADIEYIPEKRLLLVPTFFHNSVTAYRVD